MVLQASLSCVTILILCGPTSLPSTYLYSGRITLIRTCGWELITVFEKIWPEKFWYLYSSSFACSCYRVRKGIHDTCLVLEPREDDQGNMTMVAPSNVALTCLVCRYLSLVEHQNVIRENTTLFWMTGICQLVTTKPLSLSHSHPSSGV